jgi:hypothetical protein
MPNLIKIFGFMDVNNPYIVSIYTMQTVFFLDVPLRGFIRFGGKNYHLQIFGGYYIGIFPLINMLGQDYYERGGELGGRLKLRGFFIDFSYIFANPEAYNIGHFKVGMGFTGRIF